MPTFDVLNDEGPKIIVCRHEQNAAFMAAAVGRLTGRPGVCLVQLFGNTMTYFKRHRNFEREYLLASGPGTSNLVTGAATATSEGDPMVAIGGVVAQPEALKQTHQTLVQLISASRRRDGPPAAALSLVSCSPIPGSSTQRAEKIFPEVKRVLAGACTQHFYKSRPGLEGIVVSLSNCGWSD